MGFSINDWWKRFQGHIRFGVSSTQMDILAKELEREKRRVLLKIDKLNMKQQRLVERVKLARQQNRTSEVDVIFQELQLAKAEYQNLIRELKVFGLESLTLRRYLKCITLLDQQKQKKIIPKILKRMQQRKLSDRLLTQQVDANDYFEDLDLAFQDVGLEPNEYEASNIDAEKKTFLREIDTLLQAEQDSTTE